MQIVAIYAAVLTLLFVGLSMRTIALRGRVRVTLGDGGDERLRRAIRVHSNFAEYVPLGLLLIGFVEAGGARAWSVHGLGLCLLLGRVLHAYGVSQVGERLLPRMIGMVLTFASLTTSALILLFFAIHPVAG
jgi:uncharacterized protein